MPWEKMLSKVIGEVDPDPLALMEILGNKETASKKDLPDTGIPMELEKGLSAMHINMEEYGTVSSTVFLASPNSFYFNERSYNKPWGIATDKEFQARWSAVIPV